VVPADRFAHDVGRALRAQPPADSPALHEAVASTSAADLYLACACARGDAAALDAFERHFLRPIAERVARSETAFAEDVVQTLRVKLLVAVGDDPPRIAQYVGRGALSSWVRMAAARAAADLRRREGAHRSAAQASADLAPPPPRDPELALLRRRYQREFEQALATTLAELPERDATILRLYSLESMSTAEIGTLYGVTNRSVQRWIADLKEQIVSETRRALAARLDASVAQVESLIGLLQSELDLSIHRFLAAPER
jgi:RNA polymerase sigma-70 factor (ECF subfamily)